MAIEYPLNPWLHEEVDRDMDEAVAYHRPRSELKALRFESAVWAAIDLLSSAPVRFRVLLDVPGVHSYRLRGRGLPYAVVHRIEGRRLAVYAIAASRREPYYWADRVPAESDENASG